MLLVTSKFVQKSNIYARNFFILIKNVLNQTRTAFITKYRCQLKYRKSSYQGREAFAIFCHLIALTLV